ncbi:MAG TPA: hypothetical protein VGM80_14970 [Gaiellaceae bacterium]
MHLHDDSRQEEKGIRGARTAQASVSPQEEHLLGLQQRVGNAAVARLVQRAPKDRPASTDAPGHEHDAPKKAAADVHARVIKYDIDQGQGLITIGSGPDQGVQVGMSGSLILDDGHEYADFTVETAEGRVSRAHVQATMDMVNRGPNVVIKAASFAKENEGKEF